MFGTSEKKSKRWSVMAASFLGTTLSLYTPNATAQSQETEKKGILHQQNEKNFPAPSPN